MRKSRKATKRPAGRAARGTSTRSGTGRRIRKGTKLARIVGLLKRPGGVTRKQVMKAVGWPSVSLHQQAANAGLKLAVRKVEGVKRYSAA